MKLTTPAFFAAALVILQSSVIAQTAAPFFDEGRAYQDALRSDQRERMVIPSNGQWYPVVNIPAGNAGVVRRLWLAFDNNNGSPAGRPANAVRIRITANQASEAQIGGPGGIVIQDFLGSGFDAELKYRTRRFGISGNGSRGLSGWMSLPMPFNNGLRVEVSQNSGTDCTVWSLAEYKLGAVDGGWVLNAKWSVNDQTQPYATVNLLNEQGRSIMLAKVSHYLSGGGGAWKNSLEGNYNIYYDGSGSPSYTAPGTEDFFASSGYFQFEPQWQNDESGLLLFENPYPGDFLAYRNFATDSMPFWQQWVETDMDAWGVSPRSCPAPAGADQLLFGHLVLREVAADGPFRVQSVMLACRRASGSTPNSAVISLYVGPRMGPAKGSRTGSTELLPQGLRSDLSESSKASRPVDSRG